MMDYEMQKQIDQLRIAKEQIRFLGEQSQRAAIHKSSPYSDEITACIRQYDELHFYCSLSLQESKITRPVLIQNIDFDLWVSNEGCTNLELMRKGNAPYAYDAPSGRIELHHIGQDFYAPFAELTFDEHNENSQLLHPYREESWRKDKKKEKAFFKERVSYWKKRAQRNYPVSEHHFNEMRMYHFHTRQDYLEELRKICEVIYGQCDAEDLDYLADMAGSFAMMRRVGAMTMAEFLKNCQTETKTDIRCTACKSSNYILHGSYQTQGEQVQRYKCKKCGKVFSPLYKSLVSGSNLSFQQWIKFIDCLYNGYTIKQTAKRCDISEHTAHENRTKLFYALKLLNDKVTLRGNIALDETYFPLSFKGNHSKQEGFVMPRAANKRGKENRKKGASKNLVCVICAVDDTGNSVAKVVGLGMSSAVKLNSVLQEHFNEEVACLYSDKSAVIRKFAEICELEIKQEKLLRKGAQKADGIIYSKDTFVINRYLQIVNSYHSRLKRFLDRFSGISTKYLSGYLYLFAWRERNRENDPEEAYKELLRVMTEPNHYLSAEDIMEYGYLPDAAEMKKQSLPSRKENIERNKEIYRRFAAGETMTSIAADYGCSKQNISVIINRMRKKGMAYRTEKDIQSDKKREEAFVPSLRKDTAAALERNRKIYFDYLNWTGSSADFYRKMAKKYDLSVNSVRNIMSRKHRIERLKDDIFIYEESDYQTLQEVYSFIYSDYTILKSLNPSWTPAKIAKQLSCKYNYGVSNIQRILNLMSGDVDETHWNKLRRTSGNDTYNRDKAIFIDYLKWTGSKKAFCEHTAEKYNLSIQTVYQILIYCMCADPERANIA